MASLMDTSSVQEEKHAETVTLEPDTGRRTQPDLTSTRLYDSWKSLIPTLVTVLLEYTARTLGAPLQRTPLTLSLCRSHMFLVFHGLFPTSPSQPHMAVSVELLAFYQTLFKCSCDAVNALASALHTHYGEVIQEPFQRSLGQVIQWFDLLQVEVECRLEGALSACWDWLAFGRDLSEGGDIHVATDGNFHHWHRRSAGDSPHFYDTSYFLSKAQVNAIGDHILRSCKSPPRQHKSSVPHEAIDQCESSYEAADGKKQKSSMDSFDDTGVMALICRHNIPLFLANIDTPGEQQKYLVALIDHLFSLLPPRATVVTLYDVGCILSRSLDQYDILPPTITKRLRFAMMAMHAYGHEWACQMAKELKAAIGLEMHTDLGDWIKRWLKCGIEEQGTAAQSVLEECGVTIDELHNEWTSQRKSQLSIRAYAPARLKRELDTVLSLQADLDACYDQSSPNGKTMTKADAANDTLEALDNLKRGHQRLMAKVEVLYALLNVHDQFPELKGVNLDFVWTLLLARDIKINIRKCAIGSFFEWDKLDHAMGGAQQAMGTKLHQQTCKAILKRQPALLTALRKFNAYCEHLEELYDPTYGIPLPMPLPMKLNDLRNDQSLLEDVWISPSTGDIPHWLEDQDVHDRIRAIHCIEEQRCLGLEADNLCRWFGDELAAIELALLAPGNKMFFIPLRQWLEHLQYIQTRWTTSLASAVQFASRATDAVSLAQKLSGTSGGRPFQWINGFAHLYIIPTEDEEPEVPSETDHNDLLPEDVVLVDILTAGVAGGEEDDTDTIAIDAELHWRSPEDIVLLASPIALLNDSCINGCMVLLYSEVVQLSPTVKQYALFSTHDLPRIQYNTPDDVLWRNMSWTCYWAKEVWILPIHRPSNVGHWVLCIVHLRSEELHLFDSFAERKPWKSDIKDMMKLIAHLLSIARQHNHTVCVDMDLDGWVARPLMTNGFDCGVWVLAVIAATLCGCHCTALGEQDMHVFRYYL
ncbi:uncharacterized protein EDB91DRAFT_1236381 [Suillus paluster]|uniref:uncharacterized protein n=1 Tax=Suillus paluster TaxID=48578 RepID=UPI001B88340F|nr:uncharacterized protein EDB91DRAFT_1236381 [Suillus paluster]KAG1745519.1 hypothetical protein EDB91DRAFT_1236381 [Suillus paluster]